ncbi:hypothetical protein CR103_00520 [Massilia psychrophila]|uniref:Uncharacterized protein n=2 Tax=Massilia psychrophila TaxID=1603353 RepID=A0A2G8T6I0_9BURK|nr:hypothetical protein [Massilia psychrophila]PIL41573.1 hypothetical protein CR103_00520 [Massilia psychrophila]GGE62073.1 hypothetical protein GCM10008020_02810 [Massilia psychrophila]
MPAFMSSDCGTGSFFPTNDGVIIDDVNTCKTLRPNMHITQARQTLTIRCSKPAYRPAGRFYATDIERIIASLESAKQGVAC